MSGVLHPVGPEPEQTYWIRRAVVLGTAVLLLVLLVALMVNATSTGSASAAAPPPVVVPAGAPATSAAPNPSATATATSSSSIQAKAKTSAKPTTKPKATASPSAKKTATKPAGPVTCAPAQLRTTLTGLQRLKPKQRVALRLSLINGTGAACVVKVTPATFALTIYSGRDRIYSTSDCATAVKPVTKKVADEASVAWSMTWNGRRSAKDCHNRPEIPRAGTYIATAKLDGAKPVTMRIILRG